MTKAHNLFHALTTPQCNAFLVECCQVDATWWPPDVRLSPALQQSAYQHSQLLQQIQTLHYLCLACLTCRSLSYIIIIIIIQHLYSAMKSGDTEALLPACCLILRRQIHWNYSVSDTILYANIYLMCIVLESDPYNIWEQEMQFY